jgi:tetratricopeptide (TPR) repeat protein
LGGHLQSLDVNDLADVMTTWLNLNPNLNRRELLFKLSTALALAAAAPLLDMADLDEYERVVRIADGSARLDEATVSHIEGVLQIYRRQGDLLGPSLALRTAMTQRQVVHRIVSSASESLKPRAISVYAELTQLVGWLCFNLGDYRAAQYYYDQARTAAHDAENNDLVTYVLCTMSHIATWQHRPRVGIDHATAAQVWAQQSDNPRARAYAADVSARAYAADHRARECYHALEVEQEELAKAAKVEATATCWYFHDDSFYWGTRSECHLSLGTPDEACEAAVRSLALVDPANLHNYVHTLALQGEARVQQGNIGEASRIVGDVARLSALTDSPRVRQRIAQLRRNLSSGEGSQPVRKLDDLLDHYGYGSRGREITKRS